MLILPGFVVENKGGLVAEPPVRTPGEGRVAERRAPQMPAQLTNHQLLQQSPTIRARCCCSVPLAACRRRGRIMVRHAVGIRCIFFPEETGPDLKSTEVNGGFLRYLPSPWTGPLLCTTQLTQTLHTKKCPLPSSTLLHLCAGLGLRGAAGRTTRAAPAPARCWARGARGPPCPAPAERPQGAEPPHTCTGYSNTKAAKKHTHFIIALCHQTTNQQHL